MVPLNDDLGPRCVAVDKAFPRDALPPDDLARYVEPTRRPRVGGKTAMIVQAVDDGALRRAIIYLANHGGRR